MLRSDSILEAVAKRARRVNSILPLVFKKLLDLLRSDLVMVYLDDVVASVTDCSMGRTQSSWCCYLVPITGDT